MMPTEIQWLIVLACTCGGYAAGVFHALLSIKTDSCPTCSIKTGDQNG